jgi:hypothetical protein
MQFELLSRPLYSLGNRVGKAPDPVWVDDKPRQHSKSGGTCITDAPLLQPTQPFTTREDALLWPATAAEAKWVSGILRHNANADASVVSVVNQRSGRCVPFTPGIREAFATELVSCEKTDEDGHHKPTAKSGPQRKLDIFKAYESGRLDEYCHKDSCWRGEHRIYSPTSLGVRGHALTSVLIHMPMFATPYCLPFWGVCWVVFTNYMCFWMSCRANKRMKGRPNANLCDPFDYPD